MLLLTYTIRSSIGIDQELKSYNPAVSASDELFDPDSGTIVPYISHLSILEGLSIV